MQVEEVIV